MGHREAILCNCPPAPASSAPSPQRAGGSERLDCPKLRIGKLVRRPLPRLPGDFGGCPRLPGPVAAPCPPPTQTHLECPWLRGAGGREGAPSGTRPPAPWCSLRFRPHGSGWTRLGGAGRSRRRGQALGAGKGTPRRGGQLPRRGVSSRLSAHAGGESQSHNFILVLPRACPPPPPSPPPVIGSQRAHSSSPPHPPPSRSNCIPASLWEWQLPASLSPSLRAGLGCVPPGAGTPEVPAAVLIHFHEELLKVEEVIAPPPPGVWGKCFRLPSLILAGFILNIPGEFASYSITCLFVLISNNCFPTMS